MDDGSPDTVRPEDTGARLRAVRELAGISVRHVARSSGLSRRELAAAERGRRPLSPDRVAAVAGVLGVDPEVFVPGALIDDPNSFRTTEERIDAVIGHDPDAWHALPATPADLPKALPVELPDPERRRDTKTREKVEASFQLVRAEMDEVLACCARVSGAGAGDDVQDLLHRLEIEVGRLLQRRSFQRVATRHQKELARARNGERLPDDRVASATF